VSSPQRLRDAWRTLDRRVLDAAVVGVLFALMAVELAGRPPQPGGRPTTVLAYLLAAAIAAPFAWHRRHPVVAVTASGAAVIAYSLGHFSAYPGWAAFALVFAVSLHSGRRLSLLALGVSVVALTASLALQPPGVADVATWITTMLTLVVALLGGDNLRSRRLRWAEMEERARRLEREREERTRQAVAAERLRIARELHDVVSHAMTVVAVQAGVANHVRDERPDLAAAAMAAVETVARSALVEMRYLLDVLREPEEPAGSLQPVPGLAGLPALVAQFEQSGLTVALRLDGSPDDLPPGIGLSAYRIVQEGLTNVMRHGGPVAEVALTCRDTGVVIDIYNDTRRRRDGHDGHGHGLIGIRERVALFGGEFSAGPDGPGFRLRVTLPAGGAA
jgi:signal transduction histidine kinase